MQESQSNVKFVQDTSKFWYKPHLSRDQGEKPACAHPRPGLWLGFGAHPSGRCLFPVSAGLLWAEPFSSW